MLSFMTSSLSVLIDALYVDNCYGWLIDEKRIIFW